MPFFAALFFGFAPMFFFAGILYWLDRYEKEPLLLLVAVFSWGMIVAAGGAYVLNTAFGLTVYTLTGSEGTTDLMTGAISAPFVEEGLKGLAVLLVFLVFRREFDSVLDGIIYAGITALGFAATENVLYIWRGYASGGWEGLFRLVLIRVILVGWQHPFYTAFTGIGLAVARLNRFWLVKIGAAGAGFGLAMLAHAVHNTLASVPLFGELTCFAGTLFDWSGVFFMLLVIMWANWLERRSLVAHLREEVTGGVMSLAQYRTACSAWAQSFARLEALFAGRFGATNRFYQVCAELAHKKQQLLKLGEEDGNSAIIARYREELARLARVV